MGEGFIVGVVGTVAAFVIHVCFYVRVDRVVDSATAIIDECLIAVVVDVLIL